MQWNYADIFRDFFRTTDKSYAGQRPWNGGRIGEQKSLVAVGLI